MKLTRVSLHDNTRKLSAESEKEGEIYVVHTFTSFRKWFSSLHRGKKALWRSSVHIHCQHTSKHSFRHCRFEKSLFDNGTKSSCGSECENFSLIFLNPENVEKKKTENTFYVDVIVVVCLVGAVFKSTNVGCSVSCCCCNNNFPSCHRQHYHDPLENITHTISWMIPI